MEDIVVNVIEMIENGLPFSMSIGKLVPLKQAGRDFIKTHARMAAHVDLLGQKSLCNFIKTGPEHWDLIYMESKLSGEPLQLTVYKDGTAVFDIDFKSLIQEASLKVLGFADDVVAVLKKLAKEAEEDGE